MKLRMSCVNPLFFSCSDETDGKTNKSKVTLDSVLLMDWNLNTPTEWDWEDLAMCNNKQIELSHVGMDITDAQAVQSNEFWSQGNILVV